MMASPTAIIALTDRLEVQLDEPNISFDPLMDSGLGKLSAQHAGVPLICRSVPICPDAQGLAPGLGTH
jgi:hypothetical protein